MEAMSPFSVPVALARPHASSQSSPIRPTSYVPLLLNLEKHHSITDWLKEMAAATRTALEKPAPKLRWLKEQAPTS